MLPQINKPYYPVYPQDGLRNNELHLGYTRKQVEEEAYSRHDANVCRISVLNDDEQTEALFSVSLVIKRGRPQLIVRAQDSNADKAAKSVTASFCFVPVKVQAKKAK